MHEKLKNIYLRIKREGKYDRGEWTGSIILKTSERGRIIGELFFIIDPIQVTITELEVKRKYRRQGYGRFLVRIMQAMAEKMNKPLVLYSLDEAIGFYKKLGFKHIPSSKEKGDLYWLPKRLKKSGKQIQLEY